jgi:hypothetical protein
MYFTEWSNMSDKGKQQGPIDGQSHWCDGQTTDEEPCYQVVRNDSDHCEAGHPNRIRIHMPEVWQDIVDDYPIGSIERRIAERHIKSEGSLDVEDISVPATAVDVEAGGKKAVISDYDIGRATWERQWDYQPPLRLTDVEQTHFEGHGLAIFVLDHPQDAVAVRVRDDALMWGEALAAPSTYRGEVGLAIRGKPIPGYEVRVRFNDGSEASFFWRELQKVNPGPGYTA